MLATDWQEYNTDLGTTFRLGKKVKSLLGVDYYNYLQKIDKNNDQFTDVTLQHRISIFNKISFARKNDRVATLAVRYFYEDRWGGDMRWNKTFRGSDSIYGESIYTNRWELMGNYQLPIEEKISLSFSATSHQQNSFYGITPDQGDQRIVFGQLIWDKKAGSSHSVLSGIALRYNYYDDNSTATIDTLTGVNAPVWSIRNIQCSKLISSRLEVFAGIKNLLNWTPADNTPFIIARSHDPFDKKVEYGPGGTILATPENPYALSFDPSYVYAPNQGIRLFGGVRYTVK